MKAYLLSLNKNANIADQWDFGTLGDILKDCNINTESVNKLPHGDKAVVVIPGRHHAGLEAQVQKELDKLNHPVLFVMGDEEADFAIEKLDVPKSRTWIQNPHLGRHDEYNRLGTGYPQHMHDNLPNKVNKKNDVYFAGQVTHQRRIELVAVLERLKRKGKDVSYKATKGFTQGLEPKEYYKRLSQARVAPAPSGAVIPDSFRLFEALECMAIPVADQRTPSGQVMEYWDWLFAEITPFPKITDWDVLPGILDEYLEDTETKVHKQTAWYLMYKRNLKHKLLEQLNG